MLEDASRAQGVVTDEKSGVRFKVLSHGPGTSHPAPESACHLHFSATLVDGSPVAVPVPGKPLKHVHGGKDPVIKAFDGVLPHMVEGDVLQMYIPKTQARSSSSSEYQKIPSNKALIAKVKLVSIEGKKTAASKDKLESRRSQEVDRAAEKARMQAHEKERRAVQAKEAAEEEANQSRRAQTTNENRDDKAEKAKEADKQKQEKPKEKPKQNKEKPKIADTERRAEKIDTHINKAKAGSMDRKQAAAQAKAAEAEKLRKEAEEELAATEAEAKAAAEAEEAS
jgi:hypothetical protein